MSNPFQKRSWSVKPAKQHDIDPHGFPPDNRFPLDRVTLWLDAICDPAFPADLRVDSFNNFINYILLSRTWHHMKYNGNLSLVLITILQHITPLLADSVGGPKLLTTNQFRTIHNEFFTMRADGGLSTENMRMISAAFMLLNNQVNTLKQTIFMQPPQEMIYYAAELSLLCTDSMPEVATWLMALSPVYQNREYDNHIPSLLRRFMHNCLGPGHQLAPQPAAHRHTLATIRSFALNALEANESPIADWTALYAICHDGRVEPALLQKPARYLRKVLAGLNTHDNLNWLDGFMVEDVIELFRLARATPHQYRLLDKYIRSSLKSCGPGIDLVPEDTQISYHHRPTPQTSTDLLIIRQAQDRQR